MTYFNLNNSITTISNNSTNLCKFNFKYELLNHHINIAIASSTETKTKKINAKTLPSYLVTIIKQRKIANNNFKKTNDLNIKKHINFLTKIIKGELKAIKEDMWLNFCKSTNQLKKNSKQYWDKIKLISNLDYKKNKAQNIIPTLLDNNIEYETDKEKALIFGKVMKDMGAFFAEK